MKSKKLIIAIILSAAVAFGCGKLLSKSDPRFLTFKNNSDQNVIFYRSSTLYPNITDINLAKHSNRSDLRSVSRNSQDSYALRGIKWEDFLSDFPDNIMIVFALNYDSVVKYASPTPAYPGSDTTQILKKQYVNIDTLINNNWIITYP